MTAELEVVCECLTYPEPGSGARLRSLVAGLPVGRVRDRLEGFVEEVTSLPLGDWEELHTRTLDLSPLFVPYVGHVAWGESYRRGAFMAELQRAEMDAGVDQRGELPDHIVPILAYLEVEPAPVESLTEVLPQAIDAMQKELRKSEPDNPYRRVLEAAAAGVASRMGEGAVR